MINNFSLFFLLLFFFIYIDLFKINFLSIKFFIIYKMDELLSIYFKAIEGDEKAWEELYKKLKSFGLKVISKFYLSADDAEDLIQTTFEKFYKSCGQFKGYTGYQLISYFKQICINVTQDFIKNQKTNRELDNNIPYVKAEKIEDRILMKNIFSILKEFTMEEQIIFVLKMKGYSEKEIADILHTAMGTVA